MHEITKHVMLQPGMLYLSTILMEPRLLKYTMYRHLANHIAETASVRAHEVNQYATRLAALCRAMLNPRDPAFLCPSIKHDVCGKLGCLCGNRCPGKLPSGSTGNADYFSSSNGIQNRTT